MTQIQQDTEMVCSNWWTSFSWHVFELSVANGDQKTWRDLQIRCFAVHQKTHNVHVPQRGKSLYQRGTFGCSILSMELILDRFIASITSRWCCSPQSKAKSFPISCSDGKYESFQQFFAEKVFLSHVFAQNPAFAGTWYVQNLWTPFERMGSTAFFFHSAGLGFPPSTVVSSI